jgi:cobaltochelatase CobS
MSKAIWTSEGYKARSNEYEGACVTCGKAVRVSGGRLVSLAGVGGVPLRNSVVHHTCSPPDSWHYRARIAHGRRLEELGVKPGEMPAEAPTESQPYPEGDQPAPAREPTEQELQDAVQKLLDGTVAKFMEAVPPLVRATLMDLTRTVEIKVAKQPAVKITNSHKILPDVVMTVVANTYPFMVGPAGSGKTTLAMQVAETLKRKFYAESRVTSEYKLIGYMDATGKYVRTQFRDAYEKGGVFLLDEVDASDPDVLTTFNSAFANDFMPFPDGICKRHKDFVALAAGNTYGRGADRQYVGRNQLDAATLDRFVVIDVDYDEIAEMAWAANDDWTLYVQQVRKAIGEEKVRHIVSPRASIYGARLLAAGMERHLVEERCIWKGLDATNRQRVMGRLS